MKKILIVDDREEVRELLETTLKRTDCEVIKAANGAEAIEIAKVAKPDLVLMDVLMPGRIDGFEATRILRGQPETESCIIIMLTGKGQGADQEKGFEAGADDYLTKPFSPVALLGKVEEALGRDRQVSPILT